MPTDGVRQLTWTLAAWDDYTHLQGQDKKTVKRINALLKDALRQPFEFLLGRHAEKTRGQFAIQRPGLETARGV